MNKIKAILVLFLLLNIFSASESVAQCAMCKAAAESDLENNTKSYARGLNKGILFLMAAPYLIVGVIFRKELLVLFKNIKSRSKQPLTKVQKQWLYFGLSVSTLWFILFLLFLSTQY